MERELREKDKIVLSWIHSNKFTTPSLYGAKFSKSASQIGFRMNLDRLYTYGFLHRVKKEYKHENTYYLTGKALRILSKEGRILLKRPTPVRVTFNQQDHDRRVIEMRTRLEADGTLGDVFWVTDFELRAGITSKVKTAFLGGSLDVIKWRKHREAPSETSRRPDGYFQATIEGERRSFVLEYIHAPYSTMKYNRVIPILINKWASSIKLMVFQNDALTVRNKIYLKSHVRNRKNWWVASYDQVINKPFLEAFEDLSAGN